MPACTPRADATYLNERDRQRTRAARVEAELELARCRTRAENRAADKQVDDLDMLEKARELVRQYGSVAAATEALLRGEVAGYGGISLNSAAGKTVLLPDGTRVPLQCGAPGRVLGIR